MFVPTMIRNMATFGRSARLMQALDAVNVRYGRRTLQPAIAGVAPAQTWSMRRQRLSPRYTTELDDILEVRA